MRTSVGQQSAHVIPILSLSTKYLLNSGVRLTAVRKTLVSYSPERRQALRCQEAHLRRSSRQKPAVVPPGRRWRRRVGRPAPTPPPALPWDPSPAPGPAAWAASGGGSGLGIPAAGHPRTRTEPPGNQESREPQFLPPPFRIMV